MRVTGVISSVSFVSNFVSKPARSRIGWVNHIDPGAPLEVIIIQPYFPPFRTEKIKCQ